MVFLEQNSDVLKCKDCNDEFLLLVEDGKGYAYDCTPTFCPFCGNKFEEIEENE